MHPVYVHIKKELSPFYAEEEASAMAKWISSDILHLSTLELYTGKDMNFFHERVGGTGGYSSALEAAGTPSVYFAGSLFLWNVFSCGTRGTDSS